MLRACQYDPTLTLYLDALETHPAYERLKNGDGLFHDPLTIGPSRQNLWSTGEGQSGYGSWVDLSAPESRKWWSEGVQGLIDLGADGMWEYVGFPPRAGCPNNFTHLRSCYSDNSEYCTRDDQHLAKNEFDHIREVMTQGKVRVGILGRITGNEMMNKIR